jgi:MoxR-like ATPase
MTLQTKIHKLNDELSDHYAERNTEIKLGSLAVLTGQNFLQIGPPGTAKSMLARDLSAAIGGRYFWALMNRHMTPEQLFGPPDLKAIKEEGRLYHVSDGMLQEAHIFFADEIFKCSSATLNDLLSVINEGLFKNGDLTVNVPLISVFAASNEMPSQDSEELGAFWDRFLLRKFVVPIREPSNFVKMLQMNQREQGIVLTLDDLRAAEDEIHDIGFPMSMLEHFVNLRNNLSYQGIEVSDRRWQQARHLTQAYAWLQERDTVIETDLSILQHVLWNTPQEIKPALRVILATANPLEEEVVDVLDQVESIEAQLRERLKWVEAEQTKEARDRLRAEAIEWFIKLEELGVGLHELQKQCKAENRPSDTVDDALLKLEDVAVQVGADAMNLGNYNRVKQQMRAKIYQE